MAAAPAKGAFMKRLCFIMITRVVVIMVTMGVGARLFWAAPAGAQEREYFLPAPGVQTYAVILAGPSPEETYGSQIRNWALLLYDILIKDYGYAPDHIILLTNATDPADRRIAGAIKKDILLEKMKTLEARVKPGDQMFFFLIGHGTSNEVEAKFVLTGPDISGEEFADMLRPFEAQDIVVVNAASASFPFCTALTGPGRVIVSATRSRAEKYNTVFAQYFIGALEAHAGDRDKNRKVSIWEAIVFATQNVQKWYEDQKRIPTEHAVLEDDGDGVFNLDPGPGQTDGSLAQIAYVDPLYAIRASDKALGAADRKLKLALDARIRELERAVFLLRHRKTDMPEDAYQPEMEKLLIELARMSRQLRQMTDVD